MTDSDVIDGEVIEEEPATGLPALYGQRTSITGGEARTVYRNDIWQRRQSVAVLRARGLTPKEIAEELTGIGLVNPKSGQPWEVSVVQSDLAALTGEWKKSARLPTGEHVARILAELQEVYRTAWSRGDLTTALLAIDRECKLLGLYSPTQVAVVMNERVKEMAEAAGLDPEELRKAATAIAEGRLP